MSRIEEALEKAARMRSGNGQSAAVRSGASGQHTPPPPGTGASITNKLLIAASDPHTPAAEEYRKLKSNIVRMTSGDQRGNMLMVTSSVGSEGKSVTALNLAISMAQEYDHTVMLVDADIRKPSLKGYLGHEEKRGLTECLLDGLDPKEAIVRTGIGRLSLLPAGREVRNPTEIFSSSRTREFFMEIRNRYHDRFIIIDTPPVLPFAETRSMCSFVDGVVLVVKEGAVSLDNVNETMESLKGAQILGIVYNQATCRNIEEPMRYYRGGNPPPRVRPPLSGIQTFGFAAA